jgi:diadenosine tetraphosphate (Ap4A) HIT family hydrolase
MKMNFENLAEDLDAAKLRGQAPWDDTVRRDFHVSVFRDRFPVTKGHLLFVPQYATWELLYDCLEDAIREGNRMVEERECDGYNVGFNEGYAAGQTVAWPHVHLIPRRAGDSPNPTGGVRKVIDGKGDYKSPNYTQPK